MGKTEIPEPIRAMAEYVGCKPEELARVYEITKATTEAEKLGLLMAF